MTASRHDTAIRAAHVAASIVRDGYARLRHVDIKQKAPGDLVTEIDAAAEVAIRATIWQDFPEDVILGEEGGEQHGPGQTPSGWLWIVDPLDGTYNFVHGNPHVCTSIACAAPDGAIDIAVIKDPFRVEVFHAQRGMGAYSGDVRLRTNFREHLQDALVSMVLPSAQHAAFERVWPAFERVARTVGQVRRTGSAALDLAYVAAGRLDAFVVMSLHKWDIAAGALLITEAGGVVTDLEGDGNYLQREEVIAGNAWLVPALVQTLKSHS